MNKEIKLKFDEQLSKILSEIEKKFDHLKVRKKGVRITSESDKNNYGELKFDFLGGQKAYYFAMTGWSADFDGYIADVRPPYGSNHPDDFDHHFFMSTIMEDRGIFSRSDGKIYLPNKEDDIFEICSHIKNCLNDVYIPWLIRFVKFSPELIESIVRRPDFYSYPSPLIAYLLKKNEMKYGDLGFKLGKGIIKNKDFDLKILEEIGS